ncbi:hypothetical protein KBG31_00430 [Patescibacteria group bacterium]|nr:hypothetical protein [Patescibacteria group bacterium]HOM77869.1 hypothetical protein [bacterium]
MIKLPFLKKSQRPNIRQNQDFLGIVLDPYKVSVVYFQIPAGSLGETPANFSSELSPIFSSSPPENTKIKIIAARSKYLSLDNVFDPIESLLDQTAQTLDILLTEMETEFPQLPDRALFGLSPRNCIDLMSLVRYSNVEVSKITQEQTQELYEQAEKNATFRAQDILISQKGNMDEDLIPITSSEILLKLDDLVVQDPVGLDGKELELSWFGSFAESSYLDFIQKVAKKVNIQVIGVASLGYSFYDSINSLPDNKNCVILDFDFSKTTVYVAFGGSLVGCYYIDLGLSGFYAEICRKLSVHLDEAIAIVGKYQTGSLSEALSIEVSKVLEKFSIVWLEGLETVFLGFSGVKTFPSKVYLTGSGFDISDFVDLVRTEVWYKSVPFKAPPEFIKASLSEEILDICGVSSLLEWILPLSLGNIYFKMI